MDFRFLDSPICGSPLDCRNVGQIVVRSGCVHDILRGKFGSLLVSYDDIRRLLENA